MYNFYVCVWPDNFWCFPCELDKFTKEHHKSDDYIFVAVPIDTHDEAVYDFLLEEGVIDDGL